MKKPEWTLLIGAMIFMSFLLPPSCFCADMVLKKNPRSIIKADSVEMTDAGIKLVYRFDEIKTINGIENINTAKLNELIELGHQYADEKKYQEAVDLLQKIAELDPSNPQIITDISRSLEGLKKYQEQLPYVFKEIEMKPGDGDAYRRLGNIYRHDPTREKEAVAAYEKAIELQGPTPVNQFDLGLTYAKKYKKCDKAIPYLEKALTLDPDSKEIRWYFFTNLGECYLALGRLEEAKAVFQKCIEKCPVAEQENVYRGLGKTYLALGQIEKAKECERKAKELR